MNFAWFRKGLSLLYFWSINLAVSNRFVQGQDANLCLLSMFRATNFPGVTEKSEDFEAKKVADFYLAVAYFSRNLIFLEQNYIFVTHEFTNFKLRKHLITLVELKQTWFTRDVQTFHTSSLAHSFLLIFRRKYDIKLYVMSGMQPEMNFSSSLKV